jgi:apolipoprotein N-acyltransferase
VSIRERLPTRRVALLAVTTAVLFLFAYAPASLVVPSFVAIVPLLWALDELKERGGTPGEAAWLGYWFGVFTHAITLYWMLIALWHFTKLSALGYAASVMVVLSPQWALGVWIMYRANVRARIPLWVTVPLAWTAVEWLQGHYSDLRFPWLGLGTSLIRVPVLVQWADIAGARGVTLWLAWINVMIFMALRRRSWKPMIPVALTIVAALGYGTWRERTIVLRPVTTVAVIQPNVDFDEKRATVGQDTVARRLIGLAERADSLPGVRLVAWSEAALEGYFYNHADWPGRVGQVARQSNIPILAGGLDLIVTPDNNFETFNAAFLFDSTGSFTHQPIYRKHYLVPIVERVPFVNPRWFGNMQWFGGFGRGVDYPVYRIREGGFGTLICYESAFENVSRIYRREGADFLVNITNDAWYGRTWATHQHAAHLVMRAIETRMGIARSANTGITEFVDPLGRVQVSIPQHEQRILTAQVYTTSERTIYVRAGDWVAILSIVGALTCLAASFRTSRNGDIA